MAKQLNSKTTKKNEQIVDDINVNMNIKYFGQPGTSTIIKCETYAAPENFIEVTSTNAPTKYHILDNAGDWILPNEITYDQLRTEAYLKHWPTNKQLEAFHDAANGDNTKLDQMNSDFNKIKLLYPK